MENIKTIIFDLGGVIMDIDVKKTLHAFSKLGLKNIHEYFGHGFAASFFSDHEAGRISDEEFLQEIKNLLDGEVSQDESVSMPGMPCSCRFPPERISLVERTENQIPAFSLQ